MLSIEFGKGVNQVFETEVTFNLTFRENYFNGVTVPVKAKYYHAAVLKLYRDVFNCPKIKHVSPITQRLLFKRVTVDAARLVNFGGRCKSQLANAEYWAKVNLNKFSNVGL